MIHLLFKKKLGKIIVLNTILLFSATYSVYTYMEYENSLLEFGDTFTCIGTILSFEKKTEYSYKHIFKIEKIILKKGEIIEVGKKNIKVYLYTNQKYMYGDTLNSYIKFEKPISNTNVGGFNNKIFMYSNGIYGYSYIEKLNEVIPKESGIIYYINIIKYRMCEVIDKAFENDIADIIRTMLLNDDSTINKDTRDVFYEIGVAHILVPSSTHLMYILIFITYIISILQIKLKYKNVLTILIILIYLIITNFAVSILRVFLMYAITIFLNLNNISNIQKNDILCLALIGILLVNPLMIYNVGLLLSFGSVLGIKLFNNKIRYKLKYGLNRKNESKLLDRGIELISITLAVQLAIIPILINCFNTVYITSLFANILVVPLSGFVILISILFSIAYNIPILSDLLIVLDTFLVSATIQICNFFNMLPLSKIYIFPLNIFELILYYVLVYTFLFSKKYLYNLKIFVTIVFEKIVGFNKFILVYIIIIIAFLICIFSYYNFVSLKIQFLDVGQGDCTFIQTYGKNILIDGGGSNSSDFDVGERVLMPYLLYNRVLKIDYIFISHFDSDHFQGLYVIIENFNVKNIVISNQYILTEEFILFMKKVKSKKINVIVVQKGHKIDISKNVYFDIIYPDNNFKPDSINNNSVVMQFIYYDMTMLFTGDIEKEVEKYLISTQSSNLKCDILKVGHHGSKSSTTQNFLDSTSPNIALIGVERKNSFGHPNSEVISQLQHRYIRVYRTDINGQINVYKYRNGNIKIWSMF